MWEFFSKVWTDLKTAIVGLLAFLEGKKAGRAEVSTELKEAADAARKDFEALEGDGRSLDAAVTSLRARRPHDPDRPQG